MMELEICVLRVFILKVTSCSRLFQCRVYIECDKVLKTLSMPSFICSTSSTGGVQGSSNYSSCTDRRSEVGKKGQ
jgi:hypothetical protein